MRKRGKGWFSFDPEDGIEWHDTMEQARARAAKVLDTERSESDEGWRDDIEDVCWGRVRQSAVVVEERKAEKGAAFDYYRDYGLRNTRRNPKGTNTAGEQGEA